MRQCYCRMCCAGCDVNQQFPLAKVHHFETNSGHNYIEGGHFCLRFLVGDLFVFVAPGALTNTARNGVSHICLLFQHFYLYFSTQTHIV